MKIEVEAEYAEALAEIERTLECEPVPGTPQSDRFLELCDAVEAYEAIHWPIERSPVRKVGR